MESRWDALMAMQKRLGTNGNPLIDLRCLDSDMAQKMEDRYTEQYMAAREGDEKKTHPENIGNIKGFESMLNIVAGFDGYACEMIEIFSDIRRTGDIYRDVYNVVMTSRATRIFPIQSGELGKQLRALFEIKYEEEQE